MSCSVHDLVRLERRGIPAVGVGTLPFADEALEQARLLGMPAMTMVLVEHPVQLLDDAGLDALADGAFERIVRRLSASDA